MSKKRKNIISAIKYSMFDLIFDVVNYCVSSSNLGKLGEPGATENARPDIARLVSLCE